MKPDNSGPTCLPVKGWRSPPTKNEQSLFLKSKGVALCGATLVFYIGGIVFESLADSLEAWIVHFLLRLRMRLDSLALMLGWIMPSQRVQQLVALGVSIC